MVVAKKRENFEHIFVLNWAPERTQRTNSRWQQKNYFTRFLNNFNIIVTYSKLYCSSNQLLSATKPSIRELEESKSREFYADVVWLSHTCMICRFTITSCWKTIYQELKKVKVCDCDCESLTGASWRKFIKALLLHDIVQVSLLLWTGGAQTVNAQTGRAVTRIGIGLTKLIIHCYRVMW